MTTAPSCRQCCRTDHLITDDGPTVCRPCVMLLGEMAGDPFAVSPPLRAAMAELHSDAVALVETESGHPEWAWLTR